jgi:hypothetical protein
VSTRSCARRLFLAGGLAGTLLAAALPRALAQDPLLQPPGPQALAQALAASTHVFVGRISGVSYVAHDAEGNEAVSKALPARNPLSVILEISVLEPMFFRGAPLPPAIALNLPGRADARFLEREQAGNGSLIYFVRREVELAEVNGRPEERTRYRLASVDASTVLPMHPAHREAVAGAVRQAPR